MGQHLSSDIHSDREKYRVALTDAKVALAEAKRRVAALEGIVSGFDQLDAQLPKVQAEIPVDTEDDRPSSWLTQAVLEAVKALGGSKIQPKQVKRHLLAKGFTYQPAGRFADRILRVLRRQTELEQPRLIQESDENGRPVFTLISTLL